MSLEGLLFGSSLILYDFDVRSGRTWNPLALGRRSQVLELALLPASPERTAS